MPKFLGFPADTLDFLIDLSQNNDRQWFAENRERYEQSFLAPALTFIEAMRPTLKKHAPHLLVEPKKSGGSLLRIYKDTRFSKDKTPYKTNMGIQFRHEAGRDIHAPGIYLHLAPDECFFGAGIWKPEAETLRQIRQFLVDNPTRWKRATTGKRFKEHFSVYDDRLKTAPRDYPKDHPLIDDLRLRSFLGLAPLTRSEIEGKEFIERLTGLLVAASPLMQVLCEALQQPY
jgi:uncharacterized protein (TIGR02453 family)